MDYIGEITCPYCGKIIELEVTIWQEGDHYDFDIIPVELDPEELSDD